MTNTTTLTIGSVNEAEDAALQAAYDSILDGWKYLGAGVHRRAYLSPSKVVYKVAHDRYGAAQASRSELDAVRILSSSPAPAGFAVPQADGVEVLGLPVVCMEYVQGVPAYLDGDDLDAARVFYRNRDTHAGNMIRSFKNGLIYMIDLGFFSVNGESSDSGCSCCRSPEGCPECGSYWCQGECMECGGCGMRDYDCVCCGLCGGNSEDCGCCRECNSVQGDCCCDFCENCTLHKDDCQGNCVCPMEDWECAFLGRLCEQHP